MLLHLPELLPPLVPSPRSLPQVLESAAHYVELPYDLGHVYMRLLSTALQLAMIANYPLKRKMR